MVRKVFYYRRCSLMDIKVYVEKMGTSSEEVSDLEWEKLYFRYLWHFKTDFCNPAGTKSAR